MAENNDDSKKENNTSRSTGEMTASLKQSNPKATSAGNPIDVRISEQIAILFDKEHGALEAEALYQSKGVLEGESRQQVCAGVENLISLLTEAREAAHISPDTKEAQTVLGYAVKQLYGNQAVDDEKLDSVLRTQIHFSLDLTCGENINKDDMVADLQKLIDCNLGLAREGEESTHEKEPLVLRQKIKLNLEAYEGEELTGREMLQIARTLQQKIYFSLGLGLNAGSDVSNDEIVAGIRKQISSSLSYAGADITKVKAMIGVLKEVHEDGNKKEENKKSTNGVEVEPHRPRN